MAARPISSLDGQKPNIFKYIPSSSNIQNYLLIPPLGVGYRGSLTSPAGALYSAARVIPLTQTSSHMGVPKGTTSAEQQPAYQSQPTPSVQQPVQQPGYSPPQGQQQATTPQWSSPSEAAQMGTNVQAESRPCWASWSLSVMDASSVMPLLPRTHLAAPGGAIICGECAWTRAAAPERGLGSVSARRLSPTASWTFRCLRGGGHITHHDNT